MSDKLFDFSEDNRKILNFKDCIMLNSLTNKSIEFENTNQIIENDVIIVKKYFNREFNFDSSINVKYFDRFDNLEIMHLNLKKSKILILDKINNDKYSLFNLYLINFLIMNKIFFIQIDNTLPNINKNIKEYLVISTEEDLNLRIKFFLSNEELIKNTVDKLYIIQSNQNIKNLIDINSINKLYIENDSSLNLKNDKEKIQLLESFKEDLILDLNNNKYNLILKGKTIIFLKF